MNPKSVNHISAGLITDHNQTVSSPELVGCGYRQTSQKSDTGQTLTLWSVLVDHYKLTIWVSLYIETPNIPNEMK